MISWVRAFVCVIQHGTCRDASPADHEREHRLGNVSRLVLQAGKVNGPARQAAVASRS